MKWTDFLYATLSKSPALQAVDFIDVVFRRSMTCGYENLTFQVILELVLKGHIFITSGYKPEAEAE